MVQKWLLKFHPDKCVAMHLGNREHIVTGHVFTINGKVIEQSVYSMEGQFLNITECEKDLGVHTDNNLNFNKHIDCTNFSKSKLYHGHSK